MRLLRPIEMFTSTFDWDADDEDQHWFRSASITSHGNLDYIPFRSIDVSFNPIGKSHLPNIKSPFKARTIGSKSLLSYHHHSTFKLTPVAWKKKMGAKFMPGVLRYVNISNLAWHRILMRANLNSRFINRSAHELMVAMQSDAPEKSKNVILRTIEEYVQSSIGAAPNDMVTLLTINNTISEILRDEDPTPIRPKEMVDLVDLLKIHDEDVIGYRYGSDNYWIIVRVGDSQNDILGWGFRILYSMRSRMFSVKPVLIGDDRHLILPPGFTSVCPMETMEATAPEIRKAIEFENCRAWKLADRYEEGFYNLLYEVTSGSRRDWKFLSKLRRSCANRKVPLSIAEIAYLKPSHNLIKDMRECVDHRFFPDMDDRISRVAYDLLTNTTLRTGHHNRGSESLDSALTETDRAYGRMYYMMRGELGR